MKGIIRKFLYETFGRANIRLQKANDVIVLTSSRSGSTWLVESLSESGKFKLFNQPTDTVYNESYYLSSLPSNIRKNPFSLNLNNEELNILRSFWHKILSGKINPNTNWRWFSKHYRFIYDSKLYKVFTCKCLVDFFLQNEGLKVIYLTRDPLQRAVSNIAYGYKDCGNLLIDNGAFSELPDADQDFLEGLYRTTSSRVSRHVISWYAENHCVLKYMKEQTPGPRFLQISYEKMVSNKKEEEAKISKFLDIKFELSQKKSKTTNKN